MQRVDEFLIPIGPDTGRLLNILIKSIQAKTIVELGTSYGYSTIFFAEAARTTGGKVLSCELRDFKIEHARQALTRAAVHRLAGIGWDGNDYRPLGACVDEKAIVNAAVALGTPSSPAAAG